MMGMIAFFPWLPIEVPVAVGDFELVPYRRGRAPAGADSATPDQNVQATLDLLFDSHYAHHDLRINIATVVRVGTHGLLDDLSEQERSDVFEWSELACFAGLAAREFFRPLGLIGSYCNADNFQVFIQRYSDAPLGMALTHRRRDGAILRYVSGHGHRIYAPPHVEATPAIAIDGDLLRALLAVHNRPEWNQIEEALSGFNRANTDAIHAWEQTEAVMMVGAFERLYGLDHGNGNKLAAALNARFQPTQSRLATTAARIPVGKFRNAATTIREAWIRDFFLVRCQPAHGRQAIVYPSVWPLREHLLLGALAFPLAVKSILSQPPLGVYTLTTRDRKYIDIFEALASADAFAHESGDGTAEGAPAPEWRRIALEHESTQRVAAAVQAFEELVNAPKRQDPGTAA